MFISLWKKKINKQVEKSIWAGWKSRGIFSNYPKRDPNLLDTRTYPKSEKPEIFDRWSDLCFPTWKVRISEPEPDRCSPLGERGLGCGSNRVWEPAATYPMSNSPGPFWCSYWPDKNPLQTWCLRVNHNAWSKLWSLSWWDIIFIAGLRHIRTCAKFRSVLTDIRTFIFVYQTMLMPFSSFFRPCFYFSEEPDRFSDESCMLLLFWRIRHIFQAFHIMFLLRWWSSSSSSLDGSGYTIRLSASSSLFKKRHG